MTIYYSAQNKGFYHSEVNSVIPSDAKEISVEKYKELLEGQNSGSEIGADDQGYPILVEYVLTLDEHKKEARQFIDQVRATQEAQGLVYTFPDEIEDTIQIRDSRDLININAQVTTSQILKDSGITAAVIPFQALSNTTHFMTPSQVTEMGVAVATYITSLYQIAWVLKTAVEAAESVEEVDAAKQWPEPA